MRGVNKVILVGNLGADPEVRYSSNGTPVTTFRIATNENWLNRDTGEREQRTEWHRIVAFGRLGEICAEYLRKGKQVYVEGRLRTRSWEDRDGNRRWVTEVVATNVVMLGSPAEPGTEFELPEEEPPLGEAPPEEDDIPF
ncbi:MAG: single-stranded DNA-binding protein [Deltaproteobacteria bacterium]|nr:MAG: single-stranded DNA-binding protein [Deltaproteobacteria bacterium]